MRRYVIHPEMTPKRLAYLQVVELNAPYEPRHGIVANHCLQLGWVESVVRLPDGSLCPWKDLPFDAKGDWVGQRLTAAGRSAMRKAGVVRA